MKTFYTLLLALFLGMTFTSHAYAAQNGGQAGQQNNYSDNAGYGGNGVGDMVQQRDQDCDGTCDGDQLRLHQQDRDQDCDNTGECNGDQDRVQARDRDQDCDGTCDGDQLQTPDRVHVEDPQYTQYQDRAAAMTRMQELMEQLRSALAKMYGWR